MMARPIAAGAAKMGLGFLVALGHTPASGTQTTVSFPATDGGIVFADEYGDGRHAVVLAHGGRFTKESWRVQAPVLVESGFRVLAIDFRGRGNSRGPASVTGDEGVEFDVLGAVRYLRRTGADNVSIVGASFGGWAAARAAIASDSGEVDRLVLLAHSPVSAPEQIPGRKLFVTSRLDYQGSGTLRLPAIQDQYERTTGPKELVILDGDAHAQFLFETEHADRLLRKIISFLLEP